MEKTNLNWQATFICKQINSHFRRSQLGLVDRALPCCIWFQSGGEIKIAIGFLLGYHSMVVQDLSPNKMLKRMPIGKNRFV
jgi:hypothetical protein